jgi:hypothetical protein
MKSFNTGEKKVFNVMSYINGDWFGKLMDTDLFNTVRVVSNTIYTILTYRTFW